MSAFYEVAQILVAIAMVVVTFFTWRATLNQKMCNSSLRYPDI